MMNISAPADVPRLKRRCERWARYPLSSSAWPMANIPNRNRMTSRLMAFTASGKVICRVARTAAAPASMTCQIRRRNRPMRLTAIRMKTAARMIIENKGVLVKQLTCVLVDSPGKG